MVLRNTYILIHIKSYYVFEGDLLLVVEVDKFSVGSKRCRTGWKSQYKGFVFGWVKLVNSLYNVCCRPFGELSIRVLNN